MNSTTNEQSHEMQEASRNPDIDLPPPAYTSNAGTTKDGPHAVSYESFSNNERMTSNGHHHNNTQNANQQPAQFVRALNTVGDQPAQVDCPYCHRVVMTRVAHTDSGMTIAAGIGLGCLCICLACLPCMLHWCADIDHYCTNCGGQLTHQPDGQPVRVVANTADNTMASRYANNPNGGTVNVPENMRPAEASVVAGK